MYFKWNKYTKQKKVFHSLSCNVYLVTNSIPKLDVLGPINMFFLKSSLRLYSKKNVYSTWGKFSEKHRHKMDCCEGESFFHCYSNSYLETQSRANHPEPQGSLRILNG